MQRPGAVCVCVHPHLPAPLPGKRRYKRLIHELQEFEAEPVMAMECKLLERSWALGGAAYAW
jgi:hypothetical protein